MTERWVSRERIGHERVKRGNGQGVTVRPGDTGPSVAQYLTLTMSLSLPTSTRSFIHSLLLSPRVPPGIPSYSMPSVTLSTVPRRLFPSVVEGNRRKGNRVIGV